MSTLTAPAPRRERHLAAGGAAPLAAPAPLRPEPRRRDHLRVVREGDRPARRLSPRAGVVLTVVVFATMLAVAGAQSLLVQGQIRLDAVEQELTDAQARYQSLRKDLAEAESPERIVAAAKAQGMVPPSDLVYLQPVEAGEGEVDAPAAPASGEGGWAAVKPLLGTPTP